MIQHTQLRLVQGHTALTTPIASVKIHFSGEISAHRIKNYVKGCLDHPFLLTQMNERNLWLTDRKLSDPNLTRYVLDEEIRLVLDEVTQIRLLLLPLLIQTLHVKVLL